jgi:serine/threonine protein kinase/WD40 repeat protein
MDEAPQYPDRNEEREIFLVALDIPAGGDREVFLDDACGSDSLLRSRIDALLAADRDASILGKETFASAVRKEFGDLTPGSAPAPSSILYSGDYKIREVIARGGMGTIYRGIQSSLGRSVALKVIQGDGSTDSRRRFRREAETLAQLNHPNIVPIHDLVRENGVPVCFSMKLVEGRTLQHILDRLRERDAETLRDFKLARLLTIFLKVCDAISFAHSRGVLHRDLKPENIMVGDFGEVLVMDWGLAKQKKEASSPGEIDKGRDLLLSSAESGGDRSFLATMEGSVMGTPRYMSPEQAMGHIDEIDDPSDVFSLGGILYAILTLRPPVEGSTLLEILAKVSSGDITPPTRFGSATTKGSQPTSRGETLTAKEVRPLPHLAGGRVPTALSAVAMKALALKKVKRYRTVAALGSDIEAYQNGFATSAEEAGTLKQIRLLMGRHKAVTAALAMIFVIASVFAVMLVKSEREARRAFALAQLEVAESARRESDLAAMTHALASIPEDLRDQQWSYLSAKRTETRRDLRPLGLGEIVAVSAVPGSPARFVLADHQGIAILHDVATGETIRRLETPHRGRVGLAVSPDGTFFALTSEAVNFISVVSIGSGEVLRTLPVPARSGGPLVISPGGGEILAIDMKGSSPQATLLDLRDGTIRWRIGGYFTCGAFSPAGDTVFLGGPSRRALMAVDAASGEVESSIEASVYSMALSPDGKRLAAGLASGEVIVVDVANPAEFRRVRLHDGKVKSLFWTAGGRLITIGSDVELISGRFSVRLWETTTFSLKAAFLGIPSIGDSLDPAFDPASGNFLSKGETLERHFLPVDQETSRIIGAEQGWAARFLSNTRLLARVEYELGLYDVSDPARPRLVGTPFPHSYVMAARHSDGVFALGKRINPGPASIKQYRAEGDAPREIRESSTAHQTISMNYDPGGKRIAAAIAGDLGLDLVDAEAGTVSRHYPGTFAAAVYAGAAGNLVAIRDLTSADGSTLSDLVVLREESPEAVAIRPFTLRLNDLACSPDRSLVALAGSDKTVRILRADTLDDVHRFRAHDDQITAVAFHPSLPILASASNDGAMKLWHYEDALLLATHYGFGGAVVMLDFSPDGRLLVAECQDEATRIYELGDLDAMKPRLNEK